MEGDFVRVAFEVMVGLVLLGWAVMGVIAFLRAAFLGK